MKAFFAVLLVLAAPAVAQDEEDEAHRVDRLRTQELNSRSPNGYAASHYTAHPSAVAPRDRGDDGYAAAQAEYRRRLAEWRRRVAACENGYYEACQQ